MFFQVDMSSGKPVYQQLIDQVKYAVACGRLRPGDRLPPIRDVAVQARVNRNTVARVYTELEREGVLYTHSGQGCFISGRGSALSRAEQRRQITARLDDLLAQACLFRFTREQVTGLFTQRLESVFPCKKGA
ncbi:MAG: GntR family transcriptional regulator [bacterium]